MAHASTSADLSIGNIFNYKNHVVLVTGGSTGLGEMAAQGFVQNGAKVIIASRKKAELEKTSSRLNKLGPGSCDYIVADLKDKAGCLQLCADVKKKTDRLTVLLNNSGSTWYVSSVIQQAVATWKLTRLQGSSIRRLSRERLGQGLLPQREIHLLRHCRPRCPPQEGCNSRPSEPGDQHCLNGRRPDHGRHLGRRRWPRRPRPRHLLLRPE